MLNCFLTRNYNRILQFSLAIILFTHLWLNKPEVPFSSKNNIQYTCLIKYNFFLLLYLYNEEIRLN